MSWLAHSTEHNRSTSSLVWAHGHKRPLGGLPSPGRSATRRERTTGPTLYDVAVRQASVRRRVQDLHSRVVTLRADVAVLNEQIEVLDEEVESLRVRAMVSETPLAIKEHAEASRHAELAHKARDNAAQQIAALEIERDELLDDVALEVG